MSGSQHHMYCEWFIKVSSYYIFGQFLTGGLGEADPSIDFANLLYCYRRTGNDQISGLFRRRP